MVGIPTRIGLFCAKDMAGKPRLLTPAIVAAPCIKWRRLEDAKASLFFEYMLLSPCLELQCLF
jgi:hypothetical protein